MAIVAGPNRPFGTVQADTWPVAHAYPGGDRKHALSAADIPGFWMSSGSGVVGPGDVLVVCRVGLQAAMEDADQSVGNLTQGRLVTDPPAAKGLVVGPRSG